MGDLVRATEQLVALATASRPDWTEDGVRTAIGAATGLGWSWPVVMTGLMRLAVDGGLPGDLVPPARASADLADPDRTHALIEATKADLEGRGPKGVDT